ncbi:MAG: glycosyltransferase family 2 protein [Oscillospiraceae bacterium]|jgi:glycosyltransferase involved in cell wall biosynthesis|nr:glycosyltransferase family 2 protein [Oscillospiraceae bacterium]
MKLIIQIPCYNEEKTLPQTFHDLPKSIDGIDEIEYLIIDDGSKDATVATARSLGIHHVVSFRRNRGLAKGFMAGIDACLRLGADIIVNTDADNQYSGEDIEKLVQPIVAGQADMVIGERPINDIEHFSPIKKKMQHFGSWVVRKASGTEVPDAPSGFRAYSRDAALRLNVINEYTYTIETIIQAGMNKTAIASVQIRTNPETRKSRLFKSIWQYMKRSGSVIVRTVIMYKPMKFFFVLGGLSFIVGAAFIIRFIVSYFTGGTGMIQSLILASMLVIIAVQFFAAGIFSDLQAANRKMLEELLLRVRRVEYGAGQDHLDNDKRSDNSVK